MPGGMHFSAGSSASGSIEGCGSAGAVSQRQRARIVARAAARCPDLEDPGGRLRRRGSDAAAETGRDAGVREPDACGNDRPQHDVAAVGELRGRPDHRVAAEARHGPLHRQAIAYGEPFARNAPALERVDRRALDFPRRRAAVRARHLERDVHVRIDPVDCGDRAFDRDDVRFVVKARMMGERLRTARQA